MPMHDMCIRLCLYNIYLYIYILILNLNIIFSFMPTPRTSCSFQSCYRGGFGVGCGLCISWFRWWLSTELYAGTKLERFGWWSLEVFVEGIVAKEGSGKCWMFLCIARIVMKVFVDICMFIWDSKIYIYILDIRCTHLITFLTIHVFPYIHLDIYRYHYEFNHIVTSWQVASLFTSTNRFSQWCRSSSTFHTSFVGNNGCHMFFRCFMMFQPKCVAPDVWKNITFLLVPRYICLPSSWQLKNPTDFMDEAPNICQVTPSCLILRAMSEHPS